MSHPHHGEFDFLLDQIPTIPVLGGVGLNIDNCIIIAKLSCLTIRKLTSSAVQMIGENRPTRVCSKKNPQCTTKGIFVSRSVYRYLMIVISNVKQFTGALNPINNFGGNIDLTSLLIERLLWIYTLIEQSC